MYEKKKNRRQAETTLTRSGQPTEAGILTGPRVNRASILNIDFDNSVRRDAEVKARR